MKPIFSDDPQAIEKLSNKIEILERDQAFMKEINKGYKKHGKEWVKTKVSLDTYHFYIRETEYSWNKGKFFPTWALTNNGSTIRTAKKRLEQLEKVKQQEGQQQ